MKMRKIIPYTIDDINDGVDDCPTRFRKFKRPRTRILHALREAKAKGY